MEQALQSYCLDCEWTARDDLVADRTRAVVEHHITTGHEIESRHISLNVEPPQTPEQN